MASPAESTDRQDRQTDERRGEHHDLMRDDQSLLRQIQNDYKRAKEQTDDWRQEVHDLYDLVAGDQWDEVTRARMLDELRPITTFNVTVKYMDAVSGLEVQNRQEVRYIPREQDDAPVNELLTNAAHWVRDESDADDEESESFIDMLIGGMGWTETFISTLAHPEGDILIERRDPLEMFWDPASRRRNLADARWLIRIKPSTVEEVEELWPESIGELGGASGTGQVQLEDIYADTLHDATNAWRYLPGATLPGMQTTRGMIPLIEYQWWTMETSWTLRTAQRGTETITAKQWGKLKEFLSANGIPYEAEPFKTRRYYRAFAAGNAVLEKGESPYQEGFTYRCMTGRRDRNTNTWFGLGRVIQDPQLWMNKFFSQILHTINSNAKGGIMASREAFENPHKAERDWARPDSIIWLDQTSDDKGNPTVIPKPVAAYPEGLDRLMQFTMDVLPDLTTGLPKEILGLANRMQSGILEAHRKQAGMVMIAWAFDSKRRYTKEQGRMLAHYIREFISDGRLVRVDSKLGPKYVPLLQDDETYTYDIIVDEAPSSPNMKERVWGLLTELMPALMKMGYPIPPDVLDFSPLPTGLVQKWKEMIEQGKQDDVQQQMRALAMAEQQAKTQKTQAEAEDEQASVRQRIADELLKRAQAEKTQAEVGKVQVETGKSAAETGRLMGGG